MKKHGNHEMKLVHLSEFYPNDSAMNREIEVDVTVYELLCQLKREEDTRYRRDRRYKLILLPPSELQDQGIAYCDPAMLLIRKMDREQVDKALSQLSKRQRRRVQAFVFEGLSYLQIARIEGVHHSVVSDSIHKTLCKMTKFLQR